MENETTAVVGNVSFPICIHNRNALYLIFWWSRMLLLLIVVISMVILRHISTATVAVVVPFLCHRGRARVGPVQLLLLQDVAIVSIVIVVEEVFSCPSYSIGHHFAAAG